MHLQKIDIDELEKLVKTSTGLDNHRTLSRRIISKIVQGINIYKHETDGGSTPSVFVNYSLVEYLFEQPVVTPSPTWKVDINDDSRAVVIGQLMGTYIYTTPTLDIDEYFIGLNNREIEVFKRTDKITKILQR